METECAKLKFNNLSVRLKQAHPKVKGSAAELLPSIIPLIPANIAPYGTDIAAVLAGDYWQIPNGLTRVYNESCLWYIVEYLSFYELLVESFEALEIEGRPVWLVHINMFHFLAYMLVALLAKKALG